MKPGTNEVQALVQLVVFECRRVGRDWNTTAVHAAIARILTEDQPRSLLEAHRAAVSAIADPGAKTPAAIAWPRYRDAVVPSMGPGRGQRCRTCSAPNEDACRRQQAQVAPEHRFVHDYEPMSGPTP